jgi:hypothetical protein
MRGIEYLEGRGVSQKRDRIFLVSLHAARTKLPSPYGRSPEKIVPPVFMRFFGREEGKSG